MQIDQPRFVLRLISFGAIGLALFHLYAAGFRPVGADLLRPLHLGVVLALAFLMFPLAGERGRLAWMIDLALVAAALGTAAWKLVNADLTEGLLSLRPADIATGLLTIVLVLEATRRIIGLAGALGCLLLLLYALAGPQGPLAIAGNLLPEALRHPGLAPERLASLMTRGFDGIYGVPLGAAASFILIVILLGAFLEVSGAGRFFADLGQALAGRLPGSIAKAAVPASALMASVSAAPAANVLGTGTVTLPLLRRQGHGPAQASGIEAAASTAGQVLPPVMAAGAFLIADFTGQTPLRVAAAALVPALLGLGSIILLAQLAALRQGQRPMPTHILPGLRETLLDGWHHLVPVAALLVLLAQGYSPARVGAWAILAVVAAAVLHAPWELFVRGPRQGRSFGPRRIWYMLRLGLTRLFEALEIGVTNAVPVSVACAGAGLVLGLAGATGLDAAIEAGLLALSQGNLLPALAAVVLASLLLGTVLPPTVAYILTALLAGPALVGAFGIPALAAHLALFWFAQAASVTPPFAPAAAAATDITGAGRTETALQALRFGHALYLIPLFLTLNPALAAGGSVPQIFWSFVALAVALAGLAAAIEGHLVLQWPLWMRAAAVPAALATLWPALSIQALGVLVLAGLIGFDLVRRLGLAKA